LPWLGHKSMPEILAFGVNALFDCATNTRYDCLSLLTVALPILHCRGLVTGWRINYLAYKAKILLTG
jgi:hypothetical protein